MTEEIITVFCIVDDSLKELSHKDDVQARMSTSEVITTALVAGKYFGGVYEKARMFFKKHGYVKNMLTKGRFNIRLRRIDAYIWTIIMKIFSKISDTKEFIVDSFPVPVCANVRVSRSKRFTSKKHYGYNAIKKEHYYGLKVHMLTTASGKPVEIFIEPASIHDMKAFKKFTLNIPSQSTIYADSAYTNYKFEDDLKKDKNILLAAKRKGNAKRKCVVDSRMQMKKRKRIETVFSSILDFMPHNIRAVSAQGLELKLIIFICVFSLFTN